MTKEELVYITIKQLRESLKSSPENFRFEDPSISVANGNYPGPTVIWQFRVEIEENRYISDPLNSVKTIIVTYNKLGRQLQCYIYNREVNSLNHAMMADAQAAISFHDWLSPMFYRSYREFMKLRKSLLKRRNDKEYLEYMKKLNNIFPTTGVDDLFK